MTIGNESVSRYSIGAMQHPDTRHAPNGVSWAAIFAGAVAAAALSLILMVLGTGLGLSAVSPWVDQGISARSFGVSTIAWISFTSLAASGMGGYIAGRLRDKWSDVDSDEVYFRDTAHGLLAWALATLLTASLLSSAVGSILGVGAKAGASAGSGVASAMSAGAAAAAAAGAATTKSPERSLAYFTDLLLRKNPESAASVALPGQNTAPAAADTASLGVEIARILGNALATGSLPEDDQHYLGQVIAQRTGLGADVAEKRVSDTYVKMRATLEQTKKEVQDTADDVRKATGYAALWIFISLLLGAFSASYLATHGGRQRDR